MLSLSPGLSEYSITRTYSFSKSILALSGVDFTKSISVVSISEGLLCFNESIDLVKELLSSRFEFWLHDIVRRLITIIEMCIFMEFINSCENFPPGRHDLLPNDPCMRRAGRLEGLLNSS